jgi:hypothetical protein
VGGARAVANPLHRRRNTEQREVLAMITISITNVHQIVLEKKGWFVAEVVGALVDMEAQVEAIVVDFEPL